MMMIRAMALAAVSWGELLCSDTAERIRGCNGHGGASSFFGIKFELDFHYRWLGNQMEDNLAMKKSIIDGNQ
jgi:hypothetical protein